MGTVSSLVWRCAVHSGLAQRAASRTVNGASETLRVVSGLLDGALIPYMVVGSFAAMSYGVARNTQDVDIVIDPTADSLERFLASIDAEAFYVDAGTARDALQRRTMFNLIDTSNGWKVDLVVRKARPFSIEEMRRRGVRTIAGVDVSIASAEDVVVAKLEWAKQGESERQLRDVAEIVRVHSNELDLRYVLEWVGSLGLDEQWSRVQALIG